MDTNIISVGFHKGEADFGVSSLIEGLSPEKMNEVRAMMMVAIGAAEDMWRRAQERKPENQANLAHN